MSLFLNSARAPRAAIKNVAGQQIRGMATEKQILMRITSTTNISKITKSMKMVSAAKMRGAESRLRAGRPFSKWMDNVASPSQETDKDGLLAAKDLAKKNMFIVLSSDRGLCGGCNSFVSKATRRQLAAVPSGSSSSLFIVGEKGRSQLRRQYGEIITGSVADCWSAGTNFSQACTIAEAVIKSGEFDKAHVLFNKFNSAIAYFTSIRPVGLRAKDVKEGTVDLAPALAEYELEPDNRDELLADLKEFHLASAIFHGMIEANTSEESARMAAMENATSNATDLIHRLRLQYNKARQSRITTELIEIISGASSLDDSN